MSSEFDNLVDVEGLDDADVQRLRGVHNLLVEAGPPPDLPLALDRLPATEELRKAPRFPTLTRGRIAAALAAVAALAVAAFGGGYLLGSSGGGPGTVRVVALHGKGSLASLRVSKSDEYGNWPMELTVTGLPKLPGPKDYYELMLARNGKPTLPCGGFKVSDGAKTTFRFTVPYSVTPASRWVVTAVKLKPGTESFPGPVVMS